MARNRQILSRMVGLSFDAWAFRTLVAELCVSMFFFLDLFGERGSAFPSNPSAFIEGRGPTKQSGNTWVGQSKQTALFGLSS